MTIYSLPKTKFCPPLPHRDVIRRPELARWMREELPANRLILLSAPAGYGKTTLLASLPEILPHQRFAWLAVDPQDNDAARFGAGLGEALGAVDPRLCWMEDQLAVSGGLPGGSPEAFPLRPYMVSLINILLSDPGGGEVALVLDDLHLITNPVIYEALDYLLDHLPPRMHLVFSTRHEPPLHLNRLRARRQMSDLKMDSLCFNLEESQRFLNGALRLNLSEPDLNRVHDKAEGWPVGLVLLTNRLRSLPPSSPRRAFFQHLERVDGGTFHYLAEEVLAQEPEELRNFLLETSILTELTPALCQQVTRRVDAGALLAELYQRNLFVSLVKEAFPPEEPVYRCHALFSEFLQRELQQSQPERLEELHTRAASAIQEPGEKIGHLLAAHNWEEAAAWMEKVGEQMLQQGMQETVAAWIAALPEDTTVRRSKLLYISGLTGLVQGDLSQAQRSLEQSLRLPVSEQETEIRGRVYTGLASLAFIRAEFPRCLDLVLQAEPWIKGLEEQIHFLMLRCSLALFWQSDWERAGKDLNQAVELVMSSDEPRLWFLLSIYLGPEFTVLPGALDLLENFCETAHRRFGDQIAPLRLGVNDTWCGIALRRGHLVQAITAGKDALSIKEQLGGYPFLGLNASLSITAAYAAYGNFAAAGEYLKQVLVHINYAELNQALTGQGLYPLGRIAWLAGRYSEARQAYRQMDDLESRLPFVEVLQKMLGGMLEISSRHYPAAEKLLLEAVALQEREWVSEIYGSARLLLASLYQRWERPQEALAQLEMVLARCEEQNTPGTVLLDMPLAAPLLRLEARSGQRTGQAARLLEQMNLPVEEGLPAGGPLTERQLEILRLMAAGSSNQAIADQLVVSLATVKSHVVHIMDRLGASSRMEAVALARQAGLLKNE